MLHVALKKYIYASSYSVFFKDYDGILIIPYRVTHKEAVLYPIVIIDPPCPFWHDTGVLLYIPATVCDDSRQLHAPVVRYIGPAAAYRILIGSIERSTDSFTGCIEIKTQCVHAALHYAEYIRMYHMRQLHKLIAGVLILRTFRRAMSNPDYAMCRKRLQKEFQSCANDKRTIPL